MGPYVPGNHDLTRELNEHKGHKNHSYTGTGKISVGKILLMLKDKKVLLKYTRNH